jgi:putative FmdB family regulatory protein
MTYEYICTACAHAWEAEQPISAAPLKACPSCGAEAAKRQVSGGAGFILRGGGWYADLYGSAKPGKKEESSGESKKDESSKKESSASTSESKPSTTTETKSTASEAKPQASTPAVKPAATSS